MIEDILKVDSITIKKDGIYGQISDYGEQELEVRTREKVASDHFDYYLDEISKHHSIPVMDKEIIRFLKTIPNNGTILDIGGCWGWHWRKINEIRPDIKVVIVELVRSNLFIAKSILGKLLDKNIFLLHGNAINLPFNDNSIDGVWSVQATQHIPSLELVYAEVFRVLKVGGLFADYNLNNSNLTKLIYSFIGKKYFIEGIFNNQFFLRRATDKNRSLLNMIFKTKISSRYTEILFSPEYKLPIGGREKSLLGIVDSHLSNFGYLLKPFARQRSLHALKLKVF